LTPSINLHEKHFPERDGLPGQVLSPALAGSDDGSPHAAVKNCCAIQRPATTLRPDHFHRKHQEVIDPAGIAGALLKATTISTDSRLQRLLRAVNRSQNPGYPR
jgi:hypothetical protein